MESARPSPSFTMEPPIGFSSAWGNQPPVAEPMSSPCGISTPGSPAPPPHLRLAQPATPGGPSGISADNNASSTAQAESIYFSTEQVGANSTAITATGFNVNAIYTDHTHF